MIKTYKVILFDDLPKTNIREEVLAFLSENFHRNGVTVASVDEIKKKNANIPNLRVMALTVYMEFHKIDAVVGIRNIATVQPKDSPRKARKTVRKSFRKQIDYIGRAYEARDAKGAFDDDQPEGWDGHKY